MLIMGYGSARSELIFLMWKRELYKLKKGRFCCKKIKFLCGDDLRRGEWGRFTVGTVLGLS